ncbi:SSI family serine proteinase inhibitor [Streptomyces sp. NPDC007346]|uniref:SSI family serine proteinase inhibitor n=1 Tax=Streptomyces sp. NPDC007346 TaxID=3154682 RepID=UPI003451DDCD
MLRRLALAAVVSLAALSTTAPAATASGPLPSAVPTSGPLSAAHPALGPLPVPLPPLPSFLGGGNGNGGGKEEPAARTRLTVTVERSGVAGADGTFELTCGPTGGTHPERQGACDRLAEAGATRAGQELFRAAPEGTMCTMIYGGDASARIVGTWEGRAVDTTVTRGDGCEISRWNNLVPVLPDVR